MQICIIGRKVECNWEEEEGTTNVCHDWDFGMRREYLLDNYHANNDTAVATPKTNWRAMQRNSLDIFAAQAGDYPYDTTLTFNLPREPGLKAHKHDVLRIVAPTVTTTVLARKEPAIMGLDGPGGTRKAIKSGVSMFDPSFKLRAVVSMPATADFEGAAGELAFVQTVRCTYRYKTFKEGPDIVATTGASYWLDDLFPYNGVWNIGVGAPVTVYVEDTPWLELPATLVKEVTQSLSFRTFLIYKPNLPGSIWVPLGRLMWDYVGIATKTSESAEWALTTKRMNVFEWTTDCEMPTWTRNGKDVDREWEAAKARGFTQEEKKAMNLIPVSEIKDRQRDYRAYTATYDTAGVSREVFQQRFEKEFNSKIAFSGAGFKTWMLPEVAARAITYPRVSLHEVVPTDKWRQPKANYYPPFGWETEWTVYVAPLCFADRGEDAAYAYWSLFSNLTTPQAVSTALQSKLSRMTVTCGEALSYGRFPVTFSRPLWIEDMRALADLPWVHLFEAKSHFGEQYLNLVVYVTGHGDVIGRNGYFIGEQGTGNIEGFLLDPMTSELTLEYMAHVSMQGDTTWFGQRQYIGGKGSGRAVEGFAIRLTGAAKSKFNLSYRAYLHGTGDTGPVQAEGFCGTRGQNRAVEAILVSITRKSSDDPILE